jgi:hypothetical protein
MDTDSWKTTVQDDCRGTIMTLSVSGWSAAGVTGGPAIHHQFPPIAGSNGSKGLHASTVVDAFDRRYRYTIYIASLGKWNGGSSAWFGATTSQCWRRGSSVAGVKEGDGQAVHTVGG